MERLGKEEWGTEDCVGMRVGDGGWGRVVVVGKAFCSMKISL